MAGTMVEGLRLTKVVDGDTVKVEIERKKETLHLCCLDTEESWAGGSKPVTNAGKLASKWTKEYFGTDKECFPASDVTVDIEFDTNDPLNVCLTKNRGNFRRLICYVFKNGENYNLKAVKKGWSPYFLKYSRTRLYHEEFPQAEAQAQPENLAIWDPETNAGGNRREYDRLVPCYISGAVWWKITASSAFRPVQSPCGSITKRFLKPPDSKTIFPYSVICRVVSTNGLRTVSSYTAVHSTTSLISGSRIRNRRRRLKS